MADEVASSAAPVANHRPTTPSAWRPTSAKATSRWATMTWSDTSICEPRVTST